MDQAIYNGTEELDEAGLVVEESWSIGAIEDDWGTPVCTGVLIDANWVLSAGHCGIDDAWFALVARGAPELRVRLPEVYRHPVVDLALLRVAAPAAISELQPLRRAREPSEDGLGVGKSVTMAGIGVTENGERGVLHFVSEPIANLSDDSFIVDGEGSSGACAGDSGGPALVATDGTQIVSGILSEGSPSCLHLDRYLRVAQYAGWIEEIMASHTGTTSSCNE